MRFPPLYAAWPAGRCSSCGRLFLRPARLNLWPWHVFDQFCGPACVDRHRAAALAAANARACNGDVYAAG